MTAPDYIALSSRNCCDQMDGKAGRSDWADNTNCVDRRIRCAIVAARYDVARLRFGLCVFSLGYSWV